MSSVNDCIKFDLDIKDKNIVFYNNFYKFFNGVQYKVYRSPFKAAHLSILWLSGRKNNVSINTIQSTNSSKFLGNPI